MTTQLPTLCLSCTRLEPTRTDTDVLIPIRCAAYPTGIPRDILRGGDHRVPRGDERGGLVYEQAPGDDAEAMFETWRRFSGA